MTLTPDCERCGGSGYVTTCGHGPGVACDPDYCTERCECVEEKP